MSEKYIHPSKRVIHKGLLGEEGQTSALCSDPPRAMDLNLESHILAKWLHDEITCEKCCEILEIDPETPSRGKMLRDNVSLRLNIAFHFIDANYWNREVRQPGEEKYNPDPDGTLAAEFLKATDVFEQLMKPVLAAMQQHDSQFGWPEDFEKQGEDYDGK